MKSSAFPVLLACLLAALCPGTSHAQFLKSLLDNVKNTAQGRANSKASQTTNNVIDKVDPASSPGTTSTAGAAGSGTTSGGSKGSSGKGGAASSGNTDSDSSYLTLNLSANKILLENAVVISGTSIKFQRLKDVALTISGPQTSVSETLPLSDSGAYKMTWQATVPGNYTVTVKSSNNKSQLSAALDVYRSVDLDSIVNDDMTGLKHAYDNLEKQIETIKGQLAPSDVDQLTATTDKLRKNKDMAIKLFNDLDDLGKGLDGIEKKYGALPASATDNLAQLSTMLTTQAQQIKQANAIVDHKSYDNTICEVLVMVGEACAAFSTFTNFWAKSAGTLVKNIAIDKGGPVVMAASGAAGANNEVHKELFKLTSLYIEDFESFSKELGKAGMAGDLVQICSNYFLKKYCAVMSGDFKEDYKCTFRNKAMVTYWDYSYNTEATISLRYPKSGSQGRIIKMKGNIEGNATKFTIYQKASEQDDFKDAKGYRASLFSICLYVPPTMPFSTSQMDRSAGFGAVARAIVTPAYFNIPIDADYDTETGQVKIYCNDALLDFSDRVEYIYGYIAIAAGIPLVARVTYPINKAKLTIAKVIEKNNDFIMKSDANHNLSLDKQGTFQMGTGTVLEHNINFTMTMKSEE